MTTDRTQATPTRSLLAGGYRGATIGSFALVFLAAFEALAVATVHRQKAVRQQAQKLHQEGKAPGEDDLKFADLKALINGGGCFLSSRVVKRLRIWVGIITTANRKDSTCSSNAVVVATADKTHPFLLKAFYAGGGQDCSNTVTTMPQDTL